MTLRLSVRASGVSASGTMAADERMQALRASGRDIVSLGAGQLDFETPAPIADAGVEAITRGCTRYTPVAGTVALRRAVRAKFEHGLAYGDDEVIVGAGAKSVIYHALISERRRVREALAARRDLACRALAAIAGITLVRPAGAFYVFADVSRHYGRTLAGRSITGSIDLADHLLDRGVAVVPGALFGDDRCLRVSFAAGPEELNAALGRLACALA